MTDGPAADDEPHGDPGRAARPNVPAAPPEPFPRPQDNHPGPPYPVFERPGAWAPQRPAGLSWHDPEAAATASDGHVAPGTGRPATDRGPDGGPFLAPGSDDGELLPPAPADDAALEPSPEEQAAAAARLRRQRTRTLVREIVETGLLALLVFLAVRASFQNFKVEGNSMYPTLDDGQFLIVNKLVYSEVDVDKLSRFVPFLDPGDNPKRWVFHGPERGDIIVLQDPRKPDTDLIKRVIGLPGETIEIVQGHVFINGYLLEEPYIKAPWSGSMPKTLIPDGEYFVMGDNRDNSLDSRSSQVGLVPKDLIVGKTLLSYWPLDDFGLAPNGSPKVTGRSVAEFTGASEAAAVR